MRSGPSWPHCCYRNAPEWAAHQGPPPDRRGDRVAGPDRCAVAGPAQPVWSLGDGGQPVYRWRRRGSGTGSWPRCRLTRTPAASWTGCCTLWTGRWCGPTSTLPVPGGGRPRPTWTRGALVDPDQPGDRDREALGRSRGGYSTKLHLRVEGRGRPMVILATAGQRHEALMLRKLMEAGRSSGRVGAGRGSGRPRWLVTRATAT